MDQKNLFLAIAISLVILVGFQYLLPAPVRPPSPATTNSQPATPPRAAGPAGVTPQDAGVAPSIAPKDIPRLRIAGQRVEGSFSLIGARLDDLVLRDYRQSLAADSPLVRLFEPRGDAQPYYAQYGWSAADPALKLPGNDTLWSASAPELVAGKPVTLSWDNGQGQIFEIQLAIDDDYMFTADQRVRNTSDAAVSVTPWTRIRRDHTPHVEGYYILHEGLLGVIDGTLKEVKYADAKSEGEKHDGLAYHADATDSWAGITDKYWLAALIPDHALKTVVEFAYTQAGANPGSPEGYQVAFRSAEAQTIPPAGEAASLTRLFAGAKEVHLLDHYEQTYGIPGLWKAIDFGWFWFMTRPFFYAIDWLYRHTGNFGLAIMIFTLGLKILFFPLANRSYRSMSKMKLLAPKMTALREQYKDDPSKLQSAMMGLYKSEKVNPASGCLPMLLQIPVFFSLYKVIFVTIEMRQAPFFGWIHDLSAVDPTNVFNLFGLLPFDPTAFSHLLHLGAWPLIMGATMYFQQKMNPPPPDPMQARLFQFMPLIFMFMLAGFPAGLVIYWSWNNLLTIGQQWLIMRQTRLAKPSLAET